MLCYLASEHTNPLRIFCLTITSRYSPYCYVSSPASWFSSILTGKCFVFPTRVRPQRPKIFSFGNGRPSLPSLYRPFTATSPDLKPLRETALDPAQRHELWSGEFPSSFSGEVIHLRTTENKFRRLQKAFDHDDEKCVLPARPVLDFVHDAEPLGCVQKT